MKCAICKNKTTWSSSFGKSSYVVCGKCFNKLREKKMLLQCQKKLQKLEKKLKNSAKKKKMLDKAFFLLYYYYRKKEETKR